MRSFTIYHSTNTRLTGGYRTGGWTKSKAIAALEHDPSVGASYTPIALVKAKDIDDAYARSENRRGSWLRNRGVLAYDNLTRVRSTQVGDVILDDLGVYHIIAIAGFDELDIPRPLL